LTKYTKADKIRARSKFIRFNFFSNMLTIRLQRTGKKNQADFRIVLAEKEAPVKKKVVEVLGSYNPRKKYFEVKEERLKYWISQRVALSETVHNLLVTKSYIQEPKIKAFSIPKKPTTKPTELPAKQPEAQATGELALPEVAPTSEKPAESPAV
jgi:small subunit ribosomal protein S16